MQIETHRAARSPQSKSNVQGKRCSIASDRENVTSLRLVVVILGNTRLQQLITGNETGFIIQMLTVNYLPARRPSVYHQWLPDLHRYAFGCTLPKQRFSERLLSAQRCMFMG